jgi:nicotinamidase-related amidase
VSAFEAPLLLLVDMQNALFEGAAVERGAEVLATAQALLRSARAAGRPVVHVADVELGAPGSRAVSVCDAVAPLADESVVHKAACDAFHETALERRCRELGARTLVVVGAKTDLCIDTTCRRATTLGFDVILVRDGHATSPSGALSANEIIAHHERILDGFGCRVGDRIHEIAVRSSTQVVF